MIPAFSFVQAYSAIPNPVKIDSQTANRYN